MRSRTYSTVLVTLLEGPMVYLWLWLNQNGYSWWWGLAALIAGELLETFAIAVQLRVVNRKSIAEVRDGIVVRRKKMERIFTLASFAEIGIWLVWLYAADSDRLGPVAGAAILFVLMHLKHQLEASAVRDVPYTDGFASAAGVIASVFETAGAVGCLALLNDGMEVLAGVVLAIGFLGEHAILVDELVKETETRDIAMPRPSRPPSLLRVRILQFVLANFRSLWGIVQQIGWLQRLLNRRGINGVIAIVRPRPDALSTMADYTSWASLTDRSYNSRHLPPTREGAPNPPSEAALADLFRREREELCPKSTALFPSFAQWFVDNFLRTQREDKDQKRDTNRNESTHHIDLSQLYGLDREQERQLRTLGGGRLKSRIENGQEWPELLCEGGEIKKEFDRLLSPFRFETVPENKRHLLFAVASDTRNVGFLSFNVLFMREHNRVAGLLAAAHPKWNDERLFSTTRMILIVLLAKIVVNEYINHITPAWFEFRLPTGGFEREPWQRQNWMAQEFNLLYRWHSLVPTTLTLGKYELSIKESLFRTDVLVDLGLGGYMKAACAQRARRVKLFNTAPFLVDNADLQSLQQGRAAKLQPYNEYRALCKLPKVRHFGEFSTDERVRDRLRELYDTVDSVDFYVGLFAEEGGPHDVLPPLMLAMVSFDAFSQLLTSPLFAPQIYGEQTFSKTGMDIIEETASIKDIVLRNRCGVGTSDFISFTQPDYDGP